jgi:hypothetical protein
MACGEFYGPRDSSPRVKHRAVAVTAIGAHDTTALADPQLHLRMFESPIAGPRTGPSAATVRSRCPKHYDGWTAALDWPAVG